MQGDFPKCNEVIPNFQQVVERIRLIIIITDNDMVKYRERAYPLNTNLYRKIPIGRVKAAQSPK